MGCLEEFLPQLFSFQWSTVLLYIYGTVQLAKHTILCGADRLIFINHFLHGLSGAVVLYHYFCSIEGIACGSPKYIIQWHLVSLSSERTKIKFSDQLHCPLVNFRNN